MIPAHLTKTSLDPWKLGMHLQTTRQRAFPNQVRHTAYSSLLKTAEGSLLDWPIIRVYGGSEGLRAWY